MVAGDEHWVAAVDEDDLRRRRKLKVETETGEIALFWHEDCPRALANICIHRERELVNGTLFDGRVVCPGHQWAFDLESGYCHERERTQPVHATHIVNGVVEVNLVANNRSSLQG